MPVTADKPAPYTAASPVLDLIHRHRSKGLPQPINADVLGRAGVPDSLIQRTLQSLQTLDLIDEQGKVTSTFEGLRLAPESEFKQRMAEWLDAAYADVLKFVDPSTDDEIKIRDAFRSYNPVGQQPRMVTLFIALYAAAGIAPAKSVGNKAPNISRTSTAPPRRKFVPKIETKKSKADELPITGMPPALDGLLKSLPLNGQGWTQQQRDKFVETFGAVLDFCIPITEQNTQDLEEGDVFG